MALSCLLLGGCQKATARQLHDSEGRSFDAECSPEGSCQLHQNAGPRRAGKPEQILQSSGRLVGICDVAAGETSAEPYDCRPLSCKSDPDCPPAHGMKDGQCLNGRCSDPAQPLAVSDSIMLCLASTGLGRESQQQIDRYAMALNCGEPCRVPKPCQKP